LPSEDEKRTILAYTGDKEQLGKAEQYMLTMSDFPGAGKRIQSMIFRQIFPARISEIKHTLDKVSEACNDVKLSDRLRKVLKAILKIGNQINDGETHAGFTLDSLLKLQTAKAFDKKTSVLQYVISVIYRNDPGILMFPEDLSNVAAASKVQMELLNGEISTLRTQWDASMKVVDGIRVILEASIKKRQAVQHLLVKLESDEISANFRVIDNNAKAVESESASAAAVSNGEEKTAEQKKADAEAELIAQQDSEMAGITEMNDFLTMV
jgi:hypothetical protein